MSSDPTMQTAVPTFYLYGEPHRSVGETFVHVEALDDRSRPSEWTIKPHSHGELCHIFLIDTGGGTMTVDGVDFAFTAPCLLRVPALSVHGFRWHEESTGSVVTMATRYIIDLIRQDETLGGLLDIAGTHPLSQEGHERLRAMIAELLRELSWSTPGHTAAVNAAILSILVIALRHAATHAGPAIKPGPYASTVARLRERIEERFRLREPVAAHAAALGVSETALKVACAKVAGTSPAKMLDERAMLEARRTLLYSNLSVSEIGYSLGFGDPAYFSRFFTRYSGTAPGRFRRTQCL